MMLFKIVSVLSTVIFDVRDLESYCIEMPFSSSAQAHIEIRRIRSSLLRRHIVQDIRMIVRNNPSRILREFDDTEIGVAPE